MEYKSPVEVIVLKAQLNTRVLQHECLALSVGQAGQGGVHEHAHLHGAVRIGRAIEGDRGGGVGKLRRISEVCSRLNVVPGRRCRSRPSSGGSVHSSGEYSKHARSQSGEGGRADGCGDDGLGS